MTCQRLCWCSYEATQPKQNAQKNEDSAPAPYTPRAGIYNLELPTGVCLGSVLRRLSCGVVRFFEVMSDQGVVAAQANGADVRPLGQEAARLLVVVYQLKQKFNGSRVHCFRISRLQMEVQLEKSRASTTISVPPLLVVLHCSLVVAVPGPSLPAGKCACSSWTGGRGEPWSRIWGKLAPGSVCAGA